MKKIHISGSRVEVIELGQLEDKLPVGNYDVIYSEKENKLYLKKLSDLVLPTPEFIDTSLVHRWLHSFRSNSSNLGILLTGYKGTGKTMLAKKLCVESNMPILNIGTSVPWNLLGAMLAEPFFHNCIVFIDEFEKTVDQEDEFIAPLLKVMDGGFASKAIFLLTSNSEEISEYLMNRLSRIKYRVCFNNLPQETINKIIDTYLIDKSFKDDLISTCHKICKVSIDILINIINEVNLFNEKASILVKDMNIVEEDVEMKVEEFYEGDWKYCGYRRMSFSDTSYFCINRAWLRNAKIHIDVKRNKGIDLSEFDMKIEEEGDYIEFCNPTIVKSDEGVFMSEGDIMVRFTPGQKTNMLF